jgi:glycine betaine/choline ABC-type transport system substrate-binding protein
MSLTRRNLIISGAAAGAAAGAALTTGGASRAVFAQDDKPTVTVGSKDFTESHILAHICGDLLEEAGYEVERQINLGGTLVAHEALVAGEIDLYVEYTGTGLLAILGQELPEVENANADASATPSGTPQANPLAEEVYSIVATEYPEQFGLEWLESWGINNTYALAMRREQVEELGVSSISDLIEHAGDLTIGAPQETLVREDGIPGLEETYGLEFGDAVGLDPGLMYSAVANGDVDVITAFATDGRIQSLDLVILEDDLNFYPPYYAAPVVRQELLDASPKVRDVLNQMAGRMDATTMTKMNFEADENGVETSEVARNYLINEGLTEG